MSLSANDVQRIEGLGDRISVEEVEHLQTEEHFAVKIHEKQAAKPKQIDRMAREFQILRLLYHPNIIRLYSAHETPTTFFMVTELASGGDLVNRLGEGTSRHFEACTEVRYPFADMTASHSRRAPMSHQGKARVYARALLAAVRHMHERNLAHRDLKPSNAPLAARTDRHLRGRSVD